MKIRFLLTAAVAVTFLGGQYVAAQQMAPYAMPPGQAGYQGGVAPMGYSAPYMPAPPPQFDVRQVGLAQPPLSIGSCSDCGSGTCGQVGCNSCGDVCNAWSHRVAVWGEYLYLRPRNAEVVYGEPVGGNGAVPVGALGMTDPDFSSGYRLGAGLVVDGNTSVSLQYTWFESTTTDGIETQAPNAVRSLVSHPGTPSATQNYQLARAAQRLRFDWIDADYRRVVSSDCNQTLTFLVGMRGGQYNQDFATEFVGNGTDLVGTEIDFYGAGLRLGLEGERLSNSRRWLVYGKTAANMVAGTFTADYRQNGTQVVDTTWKAGRIVPMLDLEIGAGWQSRCGTWRITGGYLISAWYNTVTTDRWIDAVQANNFTGLSDTMTFDGVVLRCEGRF